MRKFLLLSSIFVATSVWAFGGIGIGSFQRHKNQGVDAIGVHVDGRSNNDNNSACPAHSERVDGLCQCVEGYVSDLTGGCVANQCLDFEATACAIDCDPITGNITYATLCNNDQYYCDENHECINPCTEESTACVDYSGRNGECVSTILEGSSCGEHKVCDALGECNICEEGYEKVNNACVAVCPTGVFRSVRDGTCSICENGNVYLSYKNDPCATTTSFTGCKNNDACGAGEFCSLDGNRKVECSGVTSGTCSALGAYTDAVIEGLGKVRWSNANLRWWAAENWCKLQKREDGSSMQLVAIEDIKCYNSDTGDLITEGSGYFGGCCAEGKSCSSNTNWNQADNKDSYSSVLYNLKQASAPGTVALASNGSSSYSGCYAFYLNLTTGSVGYGNRTNADPALCK